MAGLLALCALVVEGLAHLLQDLRLGIAVVSSLGTPPADSSDLVGCHCSGLGFLLLFTMVGNSTLVLCLGFLLQ